MKQKADRQFWWLFGIVALCGVILPLALRWIWEIGDFSKITSTEQLSGFSLWWIEHHTEVMVSLNRFFSVMETAAVLVLAYRYRFAHYIFGILPLIIHVVGNIMLTSSSWGNLGWAIGSMAYGILSFLITYAIYFGTAQLKRVRVSFPIYAGIALVAVWMARFIETSITAQQIIWTYWTQLLLRIPICVIAIGLYYLLYRFYGKKERIAAE